MSLALEWFSTLLADLALQSLQVNLTSEYHFNGVDTLEKMVPGYIAFRIYGFLCVDEVLPAMVCLLDHSPKQSNLDLPNRRIWNVRGGCVRTAENLQRNFHIIPWSWIVLTSFDLQMTLAHGGKNSSQTHDSGDLWAGLWNPSAAACQVNST